MFPERVETERLVLEAATTETVDPLALYEHVREGAPHIDEITEYVTWDPHETPRESAEFLELVTDERQGGEGATYVIRPKPGEDGAGEFAGLTGLAVDWDAKTATFGAWLRKPFWGRGYSGERAAAFMEVAFDRLDLETVVVTVHDGNEKSRKAVSRYVEAHGGRREGLLRNFEVNVDGSVADVHRFTVTAAEYRATTADDE
ncbi:GNAT family N-acetyltransferase [Halosimplex litoreum]|uniref:GNAT family N-acetyltransferase n=1 Tax=Halosimplex litoreum TaxID=1198301 RepID=A0A7U3WT80_9EURY|nr:GNAT family protein [Halosimplex litoreum]QPV65144.1 GNAT family N-acetyltransferase [Halosimplex litoreum]